MADLEEEKEGGYGITIAVGIIIIVGITLLFVNKKLPGLMVSIKNALGFG